MIDVGIVLHEILVLIEQIDPFAPLELSGLHLTFDRELDHLDQLELAVLDRR